MAAILARLRAEARSRWRAWLGLVVLVGAAGGATIAAASGARRTDTAYPRFLEATKAADVAMPIFPWLPIARFDAAKIASIPQVARLDRITDYFTDNSPLVGASRDPAVLRRFEIREGRLPNPDRIDEVVVGFKEAERSHTRVGGQLVVHFNGDEEFGIKPTTHTFRVVGITASAGDFPPGQEGTPLWPEVYATPAFDRAFGAHLSRFRVLAAQLRKGAADLPAFERALERAVGRQGFLIFRERDHADAVQRPIRLQVVALWLLAGLLAVAALLTLSQSISRQIGLDSNEYPALRALGMTQKQLWGLGVARASLVAAGGAALASGLAVLLSPLTPIGLTRTAEPTPGFAVDGALLGAGLAGIVLLISLLAAWPAWRAARAASTLVDDASTRERPSATATALARAGFSASAVTGVRLAVESGRGATRVPARATIASVTLGIAALATAFGFAGSLGHLTRTPRLYGFNFDGSLFVQDGVASIAENLRSDSRIEAFSGSSGGNPLFVNGAAVQAIALEGTIVPPILQGREPRGPHADREILLGSQTLRATGAHIGETVPVRIQGSGQKPLQMKIVGRAVFPAFGATVGLGKGALINFGAARDLIGDLAPGDEPPTFDSELSVRFASGVDKKAAFADLRSRLDTNANLRQPLPDDLVNFRRVDDMPIVLASGLAALAAATIAHALVTSIRRRRRDLAILKTLGFDRSQVRRTVASQATAIIVVSLVVGLPVGVALGRWAWGIFATQIGIVNEPRASLLPVLLTIPGAVILANLLAAAPGRVAARLRPALVLRTE